MADELLGYYEKELAYIRQLGTEFAKEHPKIAGRLGMNTDTIEDPHASRLIESFAYLNARIQHKLDDEFPELSDALLSVLFPHYQRPIPSMSVVQFQPDKEQLDSHFRVPKGSHVETESFKGETCKFQTTYDVDMLPIELSTATLAGRPFSYPGSEQARGAASVLKLAFKTFNDGIQLQEVQPKKLRLYLKGQSQFSYPLAQLLLNDCTHLYMATSDTDTAPVRLKASSIEPVGYKVDEGLLPYPKNAFLGYRLLTEFFVFPDKFMFVDVNLASPFTERFDNEFCLYFYFSNSDLELEHNTSKDSFALNCSPVVNLFQQTADPIRLDHVQTEYQVIPDARRPKGFEVYSVDKVSATDATGKADTYFPFYGIPHAHKGDEHFAYWHAQRRASTMGTFNRDDGTDVFLSLVDLNFDPNVPQEKTLMVNTTCSNRDLPNKLPYTIDQPKLQCVDQSPPCARINCLTQPSPTLRPPLRNRARWRLVSHLNLNATALTGHENPTEAFKEMLRLYDFKDSSATKGVIESIMALEVRPITAPITVDGRVSICRGLEIDVTLDPNLLTGSSCFMFATVLEHFFALYCPINSFTRTVVRLKGKEGYFKKCPPRSGEKVLL